MVEPYKSVVNPVTATTKPLLASNQPLPPPVRTQQIAKDIEAFQSFVTKTDSVVAGITNAIAKSRAAAAASDLMEKLYRWRNHPPEGATNMGDLNPTKLQDLKSASLPNYTGENIDKVGYENYIVDNQTQFNKLVMESSGHLDDFAKSLFNDAVKNTVYPKFINDLTAEATSKVLHFHIENLDNHTTSVLKQSVDMVKSNQLDASKVDLGAVIASDIDGLAQLTGHTKQFLYESKIYPALVSLLTSPDYEGNYALGEQILEINKRYLNVQQYGKLKSLIETGVLSDQAAAAGRIAGNKAFTSYDTNTVVLDGSGNLATNEKEIYDSVKSGKEMDWAKLAKKNGVNINSAYGKKWLESAQMVVASKIAAVQTHQREIMERLSYKQNVVGGAIEYRNTAEFKHLYSQLNMRNRAIIDSLDTGAGEVTSSNIVNQIQMGLSGSKVEPWVSKLIGDLQANPALLTSLVNDHRLNEADAEKVAQLLSRSEGGRSKKPPNITDLLYQGVGELLRDLGYVNSFERIQDEKGFWEIDKYSRTQDEIRQKGKGVTAFNSAKAIVSAIYGDWVEWVDERQRQGDEITPELATGWVMRHIEHVVKHKTQAGGIAYISTDNNRENRNAYSAIDDHKLGSEDSVFIAGSNINRENKILLVELGDLRNLNHLQKAVHKMVNFIKDEFPVDDAREFLNLLNSNELVKTKNPQEFFQKASFLTGGGGNLSQRVLYQRNILKYLFARTFQ